MKNIPIVLILVIALLSFPVQSLADEPPKTPKNLRIIGVTKTLKVGDIVDLPGGIQLRYDKYISEKKEALIQEWASGIKKEDIKIREGIQTILSSGRCIEFHSVTEAGTVVYGTCTKREKN